MPATRAAEITWHASAILELLLGADVFGWHKISQTDYEKGLRDGYTMASEIYGPKIDPSPKGEGA